jgi:hypothetical protein
LRYRQGQDYPADPAGPEDPAHFAVVPGHEAPEVEEVVARRDGYDVVNKDEGMPRRIAEVTDPR